MYKLIWPQTCHKEYLDEISSYFNLSSIEINNAYNKYYEIVIKYKHTKLGNFKTLNTIEAFIPYLIITQNHPQIIIEIGTWQGRSTRRLIDICKELHLDTKIICYDIVNKLQYVNKNEVNLNIKDITGYVKEELNKYHGGLIYLDAHPYDLTKEVIVEVLKTNTWKLIIHDCGKHLCNPDMQIPKDRPDLITSLTGHWERHVLADIFEISNPLNNMLDSIYIPTHKLKIFNTMHGICALVPR